MAETFFIFIFLLKYICVCVSAIKISLWAINGVEAERYRVQRKRLTTIALLSFLSFHGNVIPSFCHTTSEYESVPPVYDPLIKQQTSLSFWVLGKDGADVRNPSRAAAAEMLHRQLLHQQATLEEPISYLCPCVPYLFLTLTNGSSECRPGVNTRLQMTQIVLEDMQHSSKNLKRRTQCSREKDQNNGLLDISADENDTNNTENYIQ